MVATSEPLFSAYEDLDWKMAAVSRADLDAELLARDLAALVNRAHVLMITLRHELDDDGVSFFELEWLRDGVVKTRMVSYDADEGAWLDD